MPVKPPAPPAPRTQAAPVAKSKVPPPPPPAAAPPANSLEARTAKLEATIAGLKKAITQLGGDPRHF